MNLVVMQNRTAVTSSLVVAESFEKEHKHVLRDIENIKISQSRHGLPNMFFESKYVNSRGREYPMYEITKEGYELLKAKYTLQKEKTKSDILYVIKHKEIDSYYKIGITNNLNQRIKIFNTASPTGIEVVYKFNLENAKELEMKLHSFLKEKNSNLEWFNISLEDLNKALLKFNLV